MEAEQLTRTCGLGQNTLPATLDRLVTVNSVGAGTFEPVTEDVSWATASQDVVSFGEVRFTCRGQASP
ncbi:hypothetical protein ABID95_004408 [Streptomyces atratus]